MIIKQWLDSASKRIHSATPTLDAELLLCHHLHKNRAYLFAFADTAISASQLAAVNADLEKLVTGYPLAYIIGKKDFWDMSLRVTEDTLIPRADTETLIETCQQLVPADFSGTMLDLGTGSGAIAIALSRMFPNAKITATDISDKALAVAKENAAQWQKATIAFVHAQWFTPLASAGGSSASENIFPTQGFDIIVSNPPYIVEDDPHLKNLTHEPLSALTAADNGLSDIKTIISHAWEKLSPQGWLVLEHGYNQGEDIRAEFARTGKWNAAQTIRDLGGNERVTFASRKNIISD